MAFNFGAFAGGLGNGLRQGVEMGETLQKTSDRRRIDEARKKGMEEAEAMRQAAIRGGIGQIKEVNVPAAAEEAPTVGRPTDGVGATAGSPATPERTEYEFNGKRYADRAQAEQAASADVPDVEDFFIKHAVPGIKRVYMEQGNVEQADAWDKWAGAKRGQAAIRSWAGAFKAAQRGDWEDAAARFGQYYTDFIDDGVDYVGHTAVKDDKGNITGFAVKLRNKKDGSESQIDLDRSSLLRMGVANNPEQLFKTEFEQQAAAAKLAAERAAEIDKEARELRTYGVKEQMKLDASGIEDNRKHGYQVQLETLKANIDRAKPGELGRKVKDLQDMGIRLTEDAVLQMAMGRMEGRTPQERADAIMRSLIQSDPLFSTKTPDDQKKAVKSVMDAVDGVVGAPASPAAAGIGAPRTIQVIVKDEKTGKSEIKTIPKP